MPAGLSINPTNGLISGKLSYASSGTYNATVTVKDPDGVPARATFVWTVADASIASLTATEMSGANPLANALTVNGISQETLYFAPGNSARLTVNPLAGSPAPLGSDVRFTVEGATATPASGNFASNPVISFAGPLGSYYTVKVGVDLNANNALDAAEVTHSLKLRDSTPTANNDSYTVSHGQTLSPDSVGLLANDFAPPGSPLTAILVAGPSNGLLLGFGADGFFTYLPRADYTGTDSFTYKANDGYDSNVATVTINVVNQAPVAANDNLGVHPGTAMTARAPGVLGNDSDADGDALTVTLLSGPANGTLSLNADGSFTYTPNAGFSGVNTFTYTASDGLASSNVATVTLDVHSPNQPAAASADSYTIVHNTVLTVQGPGVLANDTDPEKDALTAVLVTGPARGSLTLNTDGSFTYTPNTNAAGTDSFTYQANDGLANSTAATVTITLTNEPPSTGDDSYQTLHGRPLSVAAPGLLDNDSDLDGDVLMTVLATAPAHGALSLGSNGSFTYTPNATWVGIDSFTYTAADAQALGNAATVYIETTNAAPIAAADFYSISAGQTLTVTATRVLSNDYDSDQDPLTASLVSGTANGTLTFGSDGSFTYTPNSSFVGRDTFVYKAYDGVAYSDPVTVTITVYAQTPVANDDEFAVAMNQTLTINAPGVLWNDAGSGTLTAQLASGPTNGTVSLAANGSFVYTPNTGFYGQDSFTYNANNGVLSQAAAAVRVNVVRVQLDMPQGPWVPINANDDNGSAWRANSNNMIPQTRDFDFLRQLPNNRTDPELRSLNITINAANNVLTGFVELSVIRKGGARIRLWSDQRKTREIRAGIYPATGPNALPATVYVEGITPTSRTIVNNAIQATPNPDTSVFVTYWQVLPALPGGVAPAPVPVAQARLDVGVSPVVNFFMINGRPVTPTPPTPVAQNTGSVVFPNGYNPNQANSQGIDATQGIVSVGQNAQGTANMRNSAVFDAQAFNLNASGQLRFIQNLTITNGSGTVQNAFTFNIGANNFVFINPQTNQILRGPVLDMFGAQQQIPFFNSQPVQMMAQNLVQITGGDTPRFPSQNLLSIGFPRPPQGGNFPANFEFTLLTNIAFSMNYTSYLTWQMPAGAGPLNAPAGQGATVLYTLGTRDWRAVFLADNRTGGLGVNRILPGSGVVSDGDFNPNDHSNPVVVGPTGNQALRIR